MSDMASLKCEVWTIFHEYLCNSMVDFPEVAHFHLLVIFVMSNRYIMNTIYLITPHNNISGTTIIRITQVRSASHKLAYTVKLLEM